MSNKAQGWGREGKKVLISNYLISVHHSAFLMQVKYTEVEVKYTEGEMKYTENFGPEQQNWKAFGQ